MAHAAGPVRADSDGEEVFAFVPPPSPSPSEPARAPPPLLPSARDASQAGRRRGQVPPIRTAGLARPEPLEVTSARTPASVTGSGDYDRSTHRGAEGSRIFANRLASAWTHGLRDAREQTSTPSELIGRGGGRAARGDGLEIEKTPRSPLSPLVHGARTLLQIARKLVMAQDGAEVREIVSARQRQDATPRGVLAPADLDVEGGGGSTGASQATTSQAWAQSPQPARRHSTEYPPAVTTFASDGTSRTTRGDDAVGDKSPREGEGVHGGCGVSVRLDCRGAMLACKKAWRAIAPNRVGGHAVMLTPLIVLACVGLWIAAVAQFPAWRLDVCTVLDPGASYADDQCKEQYEREFGVGAGILNWVLMRKCFTKLDPDYLGMWGARFDPLLYAEGNRWWTLASSAFVHVDFWHLATNSFAFAAIGGFLERRYGAVRLAPTVLLTIVGGNLLSTLFESNCSIYSGLSGGVYGMVALLIADLVVNFDSILRPIPRILIFLGAVAIMTVELITDDAVSSYSHLGGLLSGLVPASLFLTRVHSMPRWKTWALLVGGLVSLVVLFFILPLLLYDEINNPLGVAPGGQLSCYGIDFPRERRGYPIVRTSCQRPQMSRARPPPELDVLPPLPPHAFTRPGWSPASTRPSRSRLRAHR